MIESEGFIVYTFYASTSTKNRARYLDKELQRHLFLRVLLMQQFEIVTERAWRQQSHLGAVLTAVRFHHMARPAASVPPKAVLCEDHVAITWLCAISLHHIAIRLSFLGIMCICLWHWF